MSLSNIILIISLLTHYDTRYKFSYNIYNNFVIIFINHMYWIYNCRNWSDINITIIIINVTLIINFFSQIKPSLNHRVDSLNHYQNKITSISRYIVRLSIRPWKYILQLYDDAQVCPDLIRCFASLLRVYRHELDLRKKRALVVS